MSKKSKNKPQETPKEKPKGPEPRGLRERVKGGWISASQALAELKAKDTSPNISIVNWLIRRGAK